MSEYESLREDIGGLGKAIVGYQSATTSHLLEQSRQIDKLWTDNAALRDELHAVANRLENLTTFVTTSPAEVAAAIVNDANRETLREVDGEAASVSDLYYYVCDNCGCLVTVTDGPIPDGLQWNCDECGSERAWEFTDKQAAFDHGAHIQRGAASGLFRRLS